MEASFSPKKVPVERPDYLAYREHSAEVFGEREHRIAVGCFGASTLQSVQTIETRADENSEYVRQFPEALLPKEEADTRIARELKDSMTIFAEQMDFQKEPESRLFLSEAFENSEIRARVEELVGISLRSGDSRDRVLRHVLGAQPLHAGMAQLLEEGCVPTNLWRTILENHRKNFEDTLTRFDETIAPKLKAEFRELATRRIEQGILPISRERIDRTLEETVLTLRDGVIAQMLGAPASYRDERQEIQLSLRLIPYPEAIAHATTHEMMHALCGKTVMQKSSAEEGPGVVDTYSDIRRGVLFAESDDTPESVGRFRWLNEALTERLTVGTLMRDRGVYASERSLLEYLTEDGETPIPFELFAHAYFEDYDPGVRPTIPHWRALQEALNESFGPGFLVDLDRKIRAKGIQAVLSELGVGPDALFS